MKKSKRFIALCKKYGVDPEKVPEVLTFESACKAVGVSPKKLPGVSHLPVRHRKRLVADYKLTIVAEALRGGKKANYNDSGEFKYFPVFRVKASEKKPSGFGLSCGDYVFWYSDSFVGVRLCFPTWDQAKFFGMHFLKLHTDHHLYT
ncbi:MAG: hypothetical protein E6H09_23505 [Bacteroidetes bacterium]|nr:MAG: hypothetical protein E6H09_23505 [Bacteroidota bacterium]